MLCNYKVDLPYPTAQVTEKNPYYAKILLDDYAGEESEHTAINLYIYQSFIQQAIWSDYADLIRCIAVVEMKHLRLLGETINLLGVKPQFKTKKNCCTIPWTANYVNPACCIRDMLNVNIQGELVAIKTYLNHISIIKDPYIVKLLQRIIIDEKQHLKCFKQVLNSLPC